MAEVNDLNVTDASNTARFPENMAPSAVNNGARALEGLLARWHKDTNGSLSTAGSSNAYTIASPNRTISAYYDGLMLCFEASFSNTGAATLNVNGVGAATIKKHHDQDLASGDIESGGKYLVVYDSGDATWQLLTALGNAPSLSSPVTTRGDIITGDGSGNEQRVAVGSSGQYLRSDGTDPGWASIALSDLPNIALGNLSNVGTATPTSGHVLTGNGSSWNNAAASTTPGDGTVTQAKLATTTEELSNSDASGGVQTQFSSMGTYGFYPEVKRGSGSNLIAVTSVGVAASYPTTVNVYQRHVLFGGNAGVAKYVRCRYVTACPPYDMGDGFVPLFAYVLLSSTGEILATDIATDPAWAHNGPTNIVPQFEDRYARKWRFNAINPGFDARAEHIDADLAAEWSRRRRLVRDLDGDLFERVARHDDEPKAFRALARDLEGHGLELVEIDTAYKQRDMARHPGPWVEHRPEGTRVVMLDPVGEVTWQLLEWHEAAEDESVATLLHEGHLRLDNEGLNRATPPGVRAVGVRWR